MKVDNLVVQFSIVRCGYCVFELTGNGGCAFVIGSFSKSDQAEKMLFDIQAWDKNSIRSLIPPDLDYDKDKFMHLAKSADSEEQSRKVVPIKPNTDAAQTLRNIADQIESGELPNEATVVCGTEVFHAGQVDDARAATDAVFNLNLGIHKLMNGALGGGE
ncbi:MULTISPECIES: hypothetical protein [unclassified Neptuniibacter]|uniref:hypothetical protein n=1 Tax=unclassified Neptuniibacter TaxID=2630693 RepID=UPI000C3EAE93|nr:MULTISPECIES: hypothetical protein [unclassified Neptuniibacter]MAY41689.1 hypothetical protein [Oceanospirillaceae bacterium]|tara:strand:- start:1228 stop:1707 length:480 start_codon:yes stop_codon:yes gene_type:complete